MSRRAEVLVALAWGAANHALFLAAVGAMIAGLYTGLGTGLGTLHGPAAWAANALLLLQFPLLHSWLLARGGRPWLARLAPGSTGRALAPTNFTLIASLQLLATFLLWSPSGVTLHAAAGAWLWASRGAFAASWLLLLLAMRDAGLPIQTGWIGWVALLRGRKVEYGPFPTHGLFRRCRQPVYLAFALALWTGPVLTLDRLLVAVSWSIYCVVAPRLKERRYLSIYGADFARYRTQVPYFLPRLKP